MLKIKVASFFLRHGVYTFIEQETQNKHKNITADGITLARKEEKKKNNDPMPSAVNLSNNKLFTLTADTNSFC